MALKLRLARRGTTNRPFYWIVVADARSPRDGKFKENIGTYNPLLDKDSCDKVVLNEERARYWLARGAQPTDRVRLFLANIGALPKHAIKVTPKKSAPKKRALERAASAKVSA
ncbi:30S ribosomal protein S16 [Candidatus Hydrogenosomobacter endosymbioticus]